MTSDQNPPSDLDETAQPSLGSSGGAGDAADDSPGDEVAPDSITDDQLPEDLRPGDDNPLARPLPDDQEVDLGIESSDSGESEDSDSDDSDTDSDDDSDDEAGSD